MICAGTGCVCWGDSDEEGRVGGWAQGHRDMIILEAIYESCKKRGAGWRKIRGSLKREELGRREEI